MQAGNKFVVHALLQIILESAVRTSEKSKRDPRDGEIALKRQRDRNKEGQPHDSIEFGPGRSIK